MFTHCSSLKELDLSNFNTNNVADNKNKVTDMERIFFNCCLFEEFNIFNFNNINVVNMEYIFGFCSKLKEFNFTNLNTSNAIYMECTFIGFFFIKRIRSF